MEELIRTNDLVVISYVDALLKDAGIDHFVADEAISAVEGSIGLFPRRILVLSEDLDAARRLMRDAGLGHELRPEKRR